MVHYERFGEPDDDNEQVLDDDLYNSDCVSNESYHHQSYLNLAEIQKAKQRTLRVVYFSMLVGSISFSIVMSSLWPYLKRIDHTVTETYLGWVNAAYSLGQMLASILFGYWCDRRPSIEPMMLSTLLLLVGSILYGYAESFGLNGIYVVLAARFVLGISAGVISVARTVSAHLSTKETRAKVMAFLALFQAAGFFIGPALQAAAQPVGSKGVYIPAIAFSLNIYTAPCFLLIILSVVNAILLIMYFKEDFDAKTRFKDDAINSRAASMQYEPLDLKMVLVTLILWFVCMTIFTLNETILAPIMMNEFAWTREHTVFYGSIILSIAGVVAIGSFLVVIPLAKKYAEKVVIFSGLFIMLIGFILYLPWGPGTPQLTPEVTTNLTNIVGCPRQYNWCHTTPSIPFIQFIAAALLVGIGYPVASVTISILYSKIIGPFPQGKYMGWFSGMGGIARIIGPLYVSAVYQHYGLRWSAVGSQGILVLSLILMGVFWKRLLPYGDWKQMFMPLPQNV